MTNNTPRLGRWVLAFGAVAALIVAAPAPASAETTADDFGQHVKHCALHMGGFDGEMNPGMHQGKAGWPGSEHECAHDSQTS